MSQCITGQITGTIVDVNTNEPLEYATAALYTQKDSVLVTGVITSQEGGFVLNNISPETYYLEVSFLGYTPKITSNIVITKSNPVYDIGVVGLILGNQLNEVVIQGERATVIHKIDRQVFDPKKFQNSQGGKLLL
ncbi:carboxypeptidase regulatory-like domain-containing protein [Cellulophaga algicola]|uniref:carboxypeptidase regulatory-like domain-containing protein n=1 Tax=Cellulophaga algicola TaxID=59600 RepID=UPI00031FEF8C|nr:carboxypeptidase regulatory-like domain-containing protein [Cellulophaga algicola]